MLADLLAGSLCCLSCTFCLRFPTPSTTQDLAGYSQITLLLLVHCPKTLNYLGNKVQTALTFKFSMIWLPVTFPAYLPTFPKISLFQPAYSVHYSQRCHMFVCPPFLWLVFFSPCPSIYLRSNCFKAMDLGNKKQPRWCPGFSSEVPNDLLFTLNIFQLFSLYHSFSTYTYIFKSLLNIFTYIICVSFLICCSIFSKFFKIVINIV